MLSQVYSSAIFGVDAYLMEIEVNYRQSPRADTVIVGLPDAAVKESSHGVATGLGNPDIDAATEAAGMDDI